MNEHRREPRRKRLLTTILFCAAWSFALIAGLRTLFSYERTGGTIGEVRQQWPAASRIPAPNERPTLVMLAHPRCPCTGASIEELAKIMAHVHGKISAYVLFLKPQSVSAGWSDTDLRHDAERIPGVTVLCDIDGTEARKFGAETSGHTFLYDQHGTLLFSGGITKARGHAGDNAGEDAIVSLVKDQRATLGRTSVFGCSLVDREHKGGSALCRK
jgi:hypothetical protein